MHWDKQKTLGWDHFLARSKKIFAKLILKILFVNHVMGKAFKSFLIPYPTALASLSVPLQTNFYDL